VSIWLNATIAPSTENCGMYAYSMMPLAGISIPLFVS
jgi:hypothetical protein